MVRSTRARNIPGVSTEMSPRSVIRRTLTPGNESAQIARARMVSPSGVRLTTAPPRPDMAAVAPAKARSRSGIRRLGSMARSISPSGKPPATREQTRRGKSKPGDDGAGPPEPPNVPVQGHTGEVFYDGGGQRPQRMPAL